MYEAFNKIKKEKQDKIINSAMEEFSKYGYEKASTNNIVSNASISKGLLFHYFSNKQGLFNFLINYSFEVMIKEINEKVNWEEMDIFERLKEIFMIKMKVSRKYPRLFHFFNIILEYKSVDEIMKEERVSNLLSKIYYQDIDYTKFKKDIDPVKALNIIKWTFEKYGDENLKKFQTEGLIDFDKISIEIDEYIDILRLAFYR
ncbi:TetR/AcrR family transcriptional regulator [Vallitalea sp.]|jgi:AcrR family transcriptional regulator|uniref:TetR/AcrR family transcriptional regulator n=1 Tax=Vallitalea sp. TaxID=1882829 RepID=UPI0025D05B84|nr:TetR/AcrR family transcriptional regulator [Vallitalea sp.]MCT4688296.1 TetR/AcrR family transcriptional regulator [Vallitalea sp.]